MTLDQWLLRALFPLNECHIHNLKVNKYYDIFSFHEVYLHHNQLLFATQEQLQWLIHNEKSRICLNTDTIKDIWLWYIFNVKVDLICLPIKKYKEQIMLALSLFKSAKVEVQSTDDVSFIPRKSRVLFEATPSEYRVHHIDARSRGLYWSYGNNVGILKQDNLKELILDVLERHLNYMGELGFKWAMGLCINKDPGWIPVRMLHCAPNLYKALADKYNISEGKLIFPSGSGCVIGVANEHST